MKIVEYKEKIDTIAEYAEEMLYYGGMLMSCLKELKGVDEYGERTGYGERGGYGERHVSRDPYSHPDYNQGAPMYGERRGRDSRGRYM